MSATVRSHSSRCSFCSARLLNVCPFRALFFAYLTLLSTFPQSRRLSGPAESVGPKVRPPVSDQSARDTHRTDSSVRFGPEESPAGSAGIIRPGLAGFDPGSAVKHRQKLLPTRALPLAGLADSGSSDAAQMHLPSHDPRSEDVRSPRLECPDW